LLDSDKTLKHDDFGALSKKLESFSAFINKYLHQQEDNQAKLTFLEKWLIEMLDFIRVEKLEKISDFINDETRNKEQNDGMLIINSLTEILRKPAFEYHFSVVTNFSDNLKILDLLIDSDQTKFKSTLDEAIANFENREIQVLLKQGINSAKTCLIEIDIKSSNIDNDRILVHYSFPNSVNIHSVDIQTVVFDNLPNMDVFLFDKEYRYILSGGKEKENYQLTNADFVGKKMFEVFDKKSQRLFYPFYNKAIAGEQTEGEVRFMKKIYHIVASPVKNKEHETIAGILISQNVTKEKQLEENLIKSKEQAQKANEAKSIFLANMSHEIRTPLNSIVGFTEQLAKTRLNKQQEKLVAFINRSSDHLLYLVNEIMILFKLGMGKVFIENTSFSVIELLNELNDTYEKQAAEKKLDFVMEIDANIPVILYGDPYRLRQIITNLVINAIKYTDQGQIKLTCQLAKETKRSARLVFHVSDTGIGISEKDLPYIFDVFEQGNRRTERIRGGAGLGLGICKRLVDLLKGEISVVSEPNKGSTFSVELSFQKSTDFEIAEKEKSYLIADKLLEGKKILLADDDNHNLILAEMILKSWHTNYTLVKDGEEAVKAAKKKKFDLLIFDIRMPKKTGVQVIKNIRSDHGQLNYYTPAIALTANVIKTDIHNYLKAGFNDFAKKPFKESHLYNKLCNVLQLEPVSPQIDNTIMNTEPNNTSDIFDLLELEKTANGDQQFYNMMLDNFINNSSSLLDVFKTGLESKNWTLIGERAHKALSSFRFFKLNNLALQLENIENTALRQKRFTDLPGLIIKIKSGIKNAQKQAKAAKK